MFGMGVPRLYLDVFHSWNESCKAEQRWPVVLPPVELVLPRSLPVVKVGCSLRNHDVHNDVLCIGCVGQGEGLQGDTSFLKDLHHLQMEKAPGEDLHFSGSHSCLLAVQASLPSVACVKRTLQFSFEPIFGCSSIQLHPKNLPCMMHLVKLQSWELHIVPSYMCTAAHRR